MGEDYVDEQRILRDFRMRKNFERIIFKGKEVVTKVDGRQRNKRHNVLCLTWQTEDKEITDIFCYY